MNKKNKYRIFLSPPNQSGEELRYFSEVLDTNWLAPGGQHVKQFESELCAITNRKYCVALNSGTAAIHLALKAIGVGPGDYVICQTFSFVATANPISYLGASPVFIDSEADTMNMDPVLLEEAIKDLRQKKIYPKAIIYAHIYGTPAKTEQLAQVSQKYNIPLIEDAAEALGSKIGENSVGKFGKISILSFNGNKVITTSGGGALLTDDDEIAGLSLRLSTQARDKTNPLEYTEVGYNYRMSNLSAALGLAQLIKLNTWVDRKREIFEYYKKINYKRRILHWLEEEPGVYANRWLSVFLLETSEQRDQIYKRLQNESIECRKLWRPLHQTGIYNNQKKYVNGLSKQFFEKGICLPSGTGLKHTEQKEIMQIVIN